MFKRLELEMRNQCSSAPLSCSTMNSCIAILLLAGTAAALAEPGYGYRYSELLHMYEPANMSVQELHN